MATTLEIPAIYRPNNQQRLFRLLLDAMAHPGSVADLSAWTDKAPAYLAVLATLCDGEVTIADPDAMLQGADWRFLEAARADFAGARFIVARGDRSPAAGLAPTLGDLTAPETGATIILVIAELVRPGLGVQASGPGIKGTREISLGTLDQEWITRRANWVRFFPMGVDLLICDRARVLALPRSTRIKSEGAAT